MNALIYGEAVLRFPGECLKIPCALTLSVPASAADRNTRPLREVVADLGGAHVSVCTGA